MTLTLSGWMRGNLDIGLLAGKVQDQLPDAQPLLEHTHRDPEPECPLCLVSGTEDRYRHLSPNQRADKAGATKHQTYEL